MNRKVKNQSVPPILGSWSDQIQKENFYPSHISNKLCETHFWETPPKLFNELNEEFNFEWDVCATAETSKCGKNFFSPEQDALKQDWHTYAKVIWMNPPYSKEGKKDAWIEKAWIEAKKGCMVVALLPAKTDTKVFHDYIWAKPNVEVRFIKGRIRFLFKGEKKSVGRSASMLVIFRNPDIGQNSKIKEQKGGI